MIFPFILLQYDVIYIRILMKVTLHKLLTFPSNQKTIEKSRTNNGTFKAYHYEMVIHVKRSHSFTKGVFYSKKTALLNFKKHGYIFKKKKYQG